MLKSDIEQTLAKFGNKFTYEELKGIATIGEPTNLTPKLLEMLCRFRLSHDYSTLITSGYRESKGTHGKGEAVDLVLYSEWKKRQPCFMEIWERAQRFRYIEGENAYAWHGIGIYTDWKVNGQRVIGLHLDVGKTSRPLNWICINNVYYYDIGGRQFESKGSKITLESAEKHFLEITRFPK